MCNTVQRAVSHEITQPFSTKISLKITHPKFTLNLPGANELPLGGGGPALDMEGIELGGAEVKVGSGAGGRMPAGEALKSGCMTWANGSGWEVGAGDWKYKGACWAGDCPTKLSASPSSSEEQIEDILNTVWLMTL